MENQIASYAERFQKALFTTFKRLGPDLMQRSKTGLTGSQFFILQFIWKEGQCRQSDLAERMEVKPSAITVIVDRLENNGYVMRKPDKHDRRVVLVELTVKGQEMLDQVKTLRLNVIGQLLSQLDEEELQAFIESFEKLAPDSMECTDCKER